MCIHRIEIKKRYHARFWITHNHPYCIYKFPTVWEYYIGNHKLLRSPHSVIGKKIK